MCLSVHVLHGRKSHSPGCLLSGHSVWYGTYMLWCAVWHSCEMPTLHQPGCTRTCMRWCHVVGAARFLFNDVSYVMTKTTLYHTHDINPWIPWIPWHSLKIHSCVRMFLEFNKNNYFYDVSLQNPGGGGPKIILWNCLTHDLFMRCPWKQK